MSNKPNLENLIKGLQIFNKYGNPDYPIHPAHDIIQMNPLFTEDIISKEDKQELHSLGFSWSESDQCFYTFKYCD